MPKDIPYSVISYNESTGQTRLDHVMAHSPLGAFREAANGLTASARDNTLFIASMPGHLIDGQGITFAGEGAVCAETVLDQLEVFR